MTNEVARKENIKLGVLYGVLAALSFAIMSVFVKKIGTALPTSMLIFFRFGISFILLLPLVLIDRQFQYRVQKPVSYMVRILTALLALFCIFYAIKFIPLVDALLLNNTAPLFVPIVAWVLTGAKTPAKALIGIILGFIGVAIILQPGKEIFSIASLIALISGLLAAIAIVQIRVISKTSTTKQMLFYYFLVSTLVAGILTAIEWKSPANGQTWLMLLGIGLFGTAYQIFVTLSYVRAPVRLMSPLMFLIVIFGGVFDWLLWNHIPNVLTVIGAILIIVGAIITVFFGHREISQQKKTGK
jgi:drug/metabolite transporter (DMT)-like permease